MFTDLILQGHAGEWDGSGGANEPSCLADLPSHAAQTSSLFTATPMTHHYHFSYYNLEIDSCKSSRTIMNSSVFSYYSR